MSLRVWLPLNGNLNQQGTTITTFSGTPAWKTYGKIGNAALNLQNKITCTTPALNGTQFFSVAFWARIENNPDSTANWMDVIGFIDQTTGGSNGQFRFETGYGNTNYSGIHWHDNATNAIVNGSYTYNTGAELDKWHHIAVTISNTAICSYYDGILKSTITSNLNKGHLTGTWWLGESTTRGCIQDVRIYDHCLSAAEVHEISQGLVLHYKLDLFQGGYGNTNLLPSNDTSWFNTSRSFEFQGWVCNFYTTTWVNEHLIQGHQYTLSYTVTCISIPDTSIYSVSETRHSPVYVHQGGGWSQVTTTNDGIISTNLLPGQSRTYKCTFTFATATETQSYYGFCGYTCLYRNADRTSTAFARFRIDNLKLELGGNVTPWSPNPSDDDYIGNNIQDSSGYGHNGTILNTVTLSPDTPRYSSSISLPNGNSMINCGRGGMVTDSITVNMWLKSSAWANPTSCTEGGGWNFEGIGDYFRFPVYVSGVGYKYGQSVTLRSNICNNQWHMITGVYDRINQKIQIYVDGVLDNDYATGTSNNIGYNGSNVIWIGAEATGSNTTGSNGMTGLFSDYRIYCTALSAVDIKQLYEVGAKIDNKQNLHTFEIIETNNNLLVGKVWTNSYGNHSSLSYPFANFNNSGEYQFTANSTSAGSEYIPINPSGHTYEYDYTISVNAGNQFYIGFERYDINKTPRSNQACIYTTNIKPSSDIIKQRYTGTVNLSTDGTNPCAFIALRILNGWSGTTSGVTGIATIHNFSLREISTKHNPSITKKGQCIEEEIIEGYNMKLHKSGIVETTEIIEF